MKIVLWNCNNGIGTKGQIEYLLSLKPDLAVLPEMKEANINLLKPDDAVWVTNNHRANKPKGLGVISFNGYCLQKLERDEEMEIYIPLNVVHKNFSFKLLAVWNFYHRCKQGRFMGVKGSDALEYAALKHYQSMFSDPCLVVGDWNIGPTLKTTTGYKNLLSILGKSGLASLYHKKHGLDLWTTDFTTHVHPRGHEHIVDFIFGSQYFQKFLGEFHIPRMDEVVLSDHAPLIMSVNLGPKRLMTHPRAG